MLPLLVRERPYQPPHVYHIELLGPRPRFGGVVDFEDDVWSYPWLGRWTEIECVYGD